jgi:hypothetical protein
MTRRSKNTDRIYEFELEVSMLNSRVSRLETSLGSIPTAARAQRVKTWHEDYQQYPAKPEPALLDTPHQLPFVFLNERFDDQEIGPANVEEIPDSLVQQGVGLSPDGWRPQNTNMFAFRVGPRWILSSLTDVDCVGMQSIFDTDFNGFAPDQNPVDVIGFVYDDDAEDTICIKTDICSLMYSFVEPVSSGVREPDGEQDDYLLGYFGDNCTVMDLCGRLKTLDTGPPESIDTPKLLWSSGGNDDPCKWSYICDIMSREFTLDPFGDPGPGAEFLYIENEVCFRARIDQIGGSGLNCYELTSLFNQTFNGTNPTVTDNPLHLMGFWFDVVANETKCVDVDICNALYSHVLEYALGDTPQTGDEEDFILGFENDTCTVSTLCYRLNLYQESLPTSAGDDYIFWTDGVSCYRATFCDYIEDAFGNGTVDDFNDARFLFIENGVCQKGTLNLCDAIGTPGGGVLANGDQVLVNDGGTCTWKTVDINNLLPCAPDEVIGGGGICIPIEACPEPIPSQTEMS